MKNVDSTDRSWARSIAAVLSAAVLPAAISLAGCSGAAQSGPQAAPPAAAPSPEAAPHIDGAPIDSAATMERRRKNMAELGERAASSLAFHPVPVQTGGRCGSVRNGSACQEFGRLLHA